MGLRKYIWVGVFLDARKNVVVSLSKAFENGRCNSICVFPGIYAVSAVKRSVRDLQ